MKGPRSTNRTKNEPEAYCGDSIQRLKDQKTQDQDKCHEEQEAEVDPEDVNIFFFSDGLIIIIWNS